MFLSIIIPVYNVEPYLRQCIDSVLTSAFTDFEVLLVIGNSSDQSNEICFAYAKEDLRIQVLSQDGKGLSNARNCGLRAASGDYLMYIDSDDFLDTAAFDRTITKLYHLRNHKYDILISDFYLVDAQGTFYGCRRQIQPSKEPITDYSYLEHLLRSSGNYCNVWRYLYRRDFLLSNQLFSKENYKSEDLDYSTRVLLAMQTCCFYHNPYYCYRVRRSGSLVNVVTMQNVTNLMEILEDCIERVKKNPQFPYGKLLIRKLIWEYFFNFLYIEDISPARDKAAARHEIASKTHILKNGFLGHFLYLLVCITGVSFWAKVLRFLRFAKRKTNNFKRIFFRS